MSVIDLVKYWGNLCVNNVITNTSFKLCDEGAGKKCNGIVFKFK